MPVYSSHLVDYQGLGVGKRIREERQRKGYTLRQLAERIKISPAQLSNIETDKTVLDVGQLAAIATALGAPIATFFPRTREYPYYIKRREQVAHEAPVARELLGPEPGPLRNHNLIWPLADPFVGKHIEPVLAQIQPLADKDIHFIGHDHEEFMFVLDGEVETLLKTNDGVVTEHLRAGDGLYFRSYLPHCHRSATSEPARALNVMYSLRGAIDSDDGEFGAPGHQFYRRGAHADVVREAAEKIGLLRRSRGFTMAELAESMGVGVRQFAQIEQGKRPPDVDLLLKLARTFRRPIEYFFATTLERRPYYFVQRGDQLKGLPPRHRRTTMSRDHSVSLFRPLAVGFPDRGMHPYYIQVTTIRPDMVSPHEHHGQEFIYLLDGELELVTYAGEEEVTEALRPGDAVFLEASVPHLLRSQSCNPLAATSAEIIDVFWTPLGEEYLFDFDNEAARTTAESASSRVRARSNAARTITSGADG